MREILDQLSQLFLQSTPTVIFVFLLLLILDRLLFRPLTAILKQREEATVGALTRARELAATAEAKSREYEEAFQAARQASYHLREEEWRAALGERENALKKARQQTESWLDEAKSKLQAEVETAKQDLERAGPSLALEITEVVLGSGPSAHKPRGTPR